MRYSFPAYLLLLGFSGEVLRGLMVGNAAANQLQLAHPGRKQRGGRVLVLGLNGIWHLSPNSDRQNMGQLHSFNS